MDRCKSREHAVTYRSLSDKDIDPLSCLVAKTWLEDDPLSRSEALALAKGYLTRELASSDYVCVAEIDGRPVGILAARDLKKHTSRMHYWRMALHALMRGALSRAGFDDVVQFIKTERLDERMLKASGRKFDASIALLAVDRDEKGMGIGGSLYNHFLDYLRQMNRHSFYLFTDSYCDYRFYEHKGLTCIGKEGFLWTTGDKAESSEFYMYANLA